MSENRWDTDWLHFSKRARRGALVFLFLFVIVALAPKLYWNYFYDSDMDPEVISLSNDLNDQNEYSSKEEVEFRAPSEAFDPNNYTLKEWMKIGLTEKQAQSIKNYIAKGGQFRYKQDVKRLYVVDNELYELLKPMIDLPDKLLSETETDLVKSDDLKGEEEIEFDKDDHIQYLSSVEINTATPEELMKVRGIGKYYAKEIVSIRALYGGIHSLDQLKGLYRMTPGKLDSLSEFLTIDQQQINKIDINSAPETKLVGHPLISPDMANSIVFIRERYGNFKSLDGLLQSPYIDQEKLKEIKPYLKAE